MYTRPLGGGVAGDAGDPNPGWTTTSYEDLSMTNRKFISDGPFIQGK